MSTSATNSLPILKEIYSDTIKNPTAPTKVKKPRFSGLRKRFRKSAKI